MNHPIQIAPHSPPSLRAPQGRGNPDASILKAFDRKTKSSFKIWTPAFAGVANATKQKAKLKK